MMTVFGVLIVMSFTEGPSYSFLMNETSIQFYGAKQILSIENFDYHPSNVMVFGGDMQ